MCSSKFSFQALLLEEPQIKITGNREVLIMSLEVTRVLQNIINDSTIVILEPPSWLSKECYFALAWCMDLLIDWQRAVLVSHRRCNRLSSSSGLKQAMFITWYFWRSEVGNEVYRVKIKVRARLHSFSGFQKRIISYPFLVSIDKLHSWTPLSPSKHVSVTSASTMISPFLILTLLLWSSCLITLADSNNTWWFPHHQILNHIYQVPLLSKVTYVWVLVL